MTNTCLLVARAERFSPNSVERDAQILHAVGQALQRRGAQVHTVAEQRLLPSDLAGADSVLSMARGRQAVELLARAAERGLRVLNPPQALLRGSRWQQAECFRSAAVPTPPTWQVRPALGTGQPLPAPDCYPLWLKRADLCAQSQGDVRHLDSPGQLAQALADFARQGIAQALVQQHAVGDLVKFYGVETPAAADRFFAWRYAGAGAFSKFGLERWNGSPQGTPFSQAALRQAAGQAACATGLVVYGGDAVITPQGEPRIIDFNDWPSFSSCREQAAEAIALLATAD